MRDATETIEVTAASWEADHHGEEAVPTPRRQQENLPDEKKISIRWLPQMTVRDLILLTMWVLSPTIAVIFVQCIDCSGWAFWLMGCCPQISPCLYHQFYDWTTSVYSYFHDNISKRRLPQPANHYIHTCQVSRNCRDYPEFFHSLSKSRCHFINPEKSRSWLHSTFLYVSGFACHWRTSNCERVQS